LTRFLPLYLVGLASKKHRRSIIHLLIETLLLRSIYLPNPVSIISYNAKIPLVFYYYLCNEEEKELALIIDIYKSFTTNPISYTGINACTSMLISGSYDFPSIISNDLILAKLLENTDKPSIPCIVTLTLAFMYQYMFFRADVTKSMLERLEKNHHGHDESRTIDLLKENFEFLKLMHPYPRQCLNREILLKARKDI